MKLATHYTSSDSKLFEVMSTYSPNEESDTWIEYRNVNTKQTYTCRLEAFLNRFSPQVN